MRRALLAAGLLVATMAVGLLVSSALGGGGKDGGGDAGAPAVRGFPTGPGRSGRSFRPESAQAALGRGVSVVAHARGPRVALYRSGGARRPYRTLSERRVDGQRIPLAFLVAKRRPGWLQVLLPVRPNKSRAWVRARDVRVAATAYRLEIQQRRHRLVAFRDGRVILRRSVALGKSVTPTPNGRYYVTDVFRPTDPKGFYGPWALGLSAYSPVLTSFAGGDGQVGLHGTNDPSVLGTNVSHGCIRVDNATITRLAHRVPLGTPVDILG